MSIQQFLKRTEQLVSANSPAILTAIGVTGTIAVGFLSGRASFKARAILDQEQYDRQGVVNAPNELPFKERALLVWKLYIPAVGVGVLTVVCIIGSNRIGTRRAAAMAAAFSMSERAWGEYKEKVIQKIGEKKNQEIYDEIAQDRINRQPPTDHEVIIISGNDCLFFDSISGRYFQSNMEAVRKAQNDINYEINHNMYANLGDFWTLIGLESTPYGNEVGWNNDNQLEITFSPVMTKDGKSAVSMNYCFSPIRDYDRCL